MLPVVDGAWDSILEDLEQRRTRAHAMGGAERLIRHREGGRLDARARVERLCDPGSFHEIGVLVGDPVPADAFVAGAATIDARPVLVGSEDFTVKGGSVNVGNEDKRSRLVQLAGESRVPLVMLLDSVGARVDSLFPRKTRASSGEHLALARLSGLVPTVGVVMGPCAGHSALTAALLDFLVMVEGASLYSGGPRVVEIATGEQVAKEDLGGAPVHTESSGVADNTAPDDATALELVRRYLSFLPSSAWSYPSTRSDPVTGGTRSLDTILDLIPADPRKPYDIRPVIELMFDDADVLEVQPAYGRSIVTSLARLGGRPVAVVASQPAVRAGAIDVAAGAKAAHCMEVADAFHLPVLLLADTPGVLPGRDSERAGILRAAARMFGAQARLRVPVFHVSLRKAYGLGAACMGMIPDRQALSVSLPGTRHAGMPPAGAGTAVGDERSAQELRAAEQGSGNESAQALWYDDVVDPRELRNALLRGLDLADARRQLPPVPVSRTSVLR